MAFQGVFLNTVQSFLLTPRIDLNIRHLPSCGTKGAIIENQGVCHVCTGNIHLIGFADSRSSNRPPRKNKLHHNCQSKKINRKFPDPKK